MQTFPRKRASIHANVDFIFIGTCAGYRRAANEKVTAVLSLDAANVEVGEALLAALDSYRVLEPSEVAEYFAVDRAGVRYAEWERDVCAKAGYGSKRNFYRGLKLVFAGLSGSILSLSATARRRGPAFKGNGLSLTVDINSGAAEVGNAVKKAIAGCA